MVKPFQKLSSASFFERPEVMPKSITSRLVAMDCEMVEGAATVDHPVEDILCRVSVVSLTGQTILDEFVSPDRPVKDYRTDVTGVDEQLLKKAGKPKKDVLARVREALKGKIIVGHGLNNDFDVLGFQPADINAEVRDTASYKPMREHVDKIPSLRSLVKRHLNKEIQTGVHSSVEDARCALALYKKFTRDWEKELKQAKYAAIPQRRPHHLPKKPHSEVKPAAAAVSATTPKLAAAKKEVNKIGKPKKHFKFVKKTGK